MASVEDLFGSPQEKRPAPPRWPNVGDYHDAFITAEPYSEQQKEVNGSWEPLYLEKQPNGSWKKKIKSELTEGRDNSKLTQIVIPAKLLTGEDVTLFFNNQAKKAALKDAMEASKLGVTVGTGIRVTRTENVGKQYSWKVQLAAPKAG